MKTWKNGGKAPHSEPRHWMEENCQLHAQAALSPGEMLTVPISKEPIWKLRRENFLSLPPGIEPQSSSPYTSRLFTI